MRMSTKSIICHFLVYCILIRHIIFAFSSSYYGSSSRLVAETFLQCPIGYDKHGTTCLKISKDFASYITAEAICAESGGRLAAPKNPTLHNSIRQVAEKSRTASYWIGLKKVNGVWTFSDGTPVSPFLMWSSGHPMIGEDYDCAVMSMRSNHSWLSAGCKWAWRYMCQYDLEVATEPPYTKSGCNPNELQLYHMSETILSQDGFLYAVGTLVSAKCQDDYASKNPIVVECTYDNTWEATETCLRICSGLNFLSFPMIVEKSNVSQTFFEGDTVSVSCAKGYVLEGERVATCLSNGTWNRDRVFCVQQKEDSKKNEKRGTDNNNNNNNNTNNNRNNNNGDKSRDCSDTWTVPKNDYPLPIITDSEFLREGQSLLVSCLQHFTIEPRSLRTSAKEWTWMKEQQIIEAPTDSRFPNVKVDETGSLLILKMSRALEGLYTCISYVDEEREVTFRSVYIALRTNCSLSLDIKPKDTIIFDGGYAILRCYAPNCTISWIKGMVPVMDDANHRVLPNGALLIMNARASDTGTYQCTALHVRTRCHASHSASVEVESALDVVCGKPMTKSTEAEEDRGKIVGGEEVEKGSHPWIALIVGDIPRKNRKPSKVFCGGSLVNNFWVLSAAHCLRAIKEEGDVSHLKIKLGKHDRTATERVERVFGVQRAVVHPHFDEDSFDNDVAMLKLSDRVYYSNYILPVCLPPKGFMKQFYPVHKSVASGFVAGWGQLKEAGLQPTELRAVQLPLISDELCKKSTSAVVTENMFCAGYNLSTGDACKGDSGGPFEMTHKGKKYLAGVVSWGEGCARPAKYGFYAKVEQYLDFIFNIWND